MRKFSGSKNFGGKSSGGRNSGGSSFRKFDGGTSFRPKKRFDRDDSSSSDTGFKLHQATCDKCGKTCDLPFKPTGGKPVYCRSCFRANPAPESRKFSKSESFDDRRSTDRFGKPEGSRGSDRFESNDTPSSTVSQQDIDNINRKLDKIMKALKID